MHTDSQDHPPCDLVMKGGITSGVVYPKLIARLAQRYRFRNIGGTSAGAIAAAGCAAAEYGRQHGYPDAFTRLGELPAELGRVSGTPPGSMLFHLFQPTPALRKHFSVLVAMLNAGPWQAVGAALLAMLRGFLGFALLGFALAAPLVVPVVLMAAPQLGFRAAIGVSFVILAGWALWTAFALSRLAGLSTVSLLAWLGAAVAYTALVLVNVAGAPVGWTLLFTTTTAAVAAVLSLGVVLVAAGASFVATLLAGLHGNFYGLCSGRTLRAEPHAQAGLTDWLARYFNELAGLPQDGDPLTFGDLWGGDASAADDATARRINLEVMTTAVSQQMCYSVPFRDGAPALYYDDAQWQRLFPPAVMQALRTARDDGEPDPEWRGAAPVPVLDATGRRLRRLPPNRHLPVVVAVRLSLSFPLLLAAVPLYAVDWSRTANRDAMRRRRAEPDAPVHLTATRVWFSDGGISSNMPLHFFDTPLPVCPTFAVNLKKPHPDHPVDQGGRIYLPDTNIGGRLRYWPEPDDAAPGRGLLAFLRGIVDTMQNWRDEIQFPYPGYRDRIVQISLHGDEGGLNLDMPERHIAALGEAGEMAADAVIARFHPRGEQRGKGWDNHQQMRLTTFLGQMENVGIDVNASLHDGTWPDVAERVTQAGRYTCAEGSFALDYLARLRDAGDAMKANGPRLYEKSLKPRAELRIAPRI
jgi:hypothetical protein